MTTNVLDYCAGIGGWDIALRELGLHGLGIENARHPRATRALNGLETVWDDLTTVPNEILGQPLSGVVGSFPCQPFSQNIKGAKAAAMLDDPRAKLMHVGLQHLLIARPAFVCLENVARAKPLMIELSDELLRAGYSTSVRVINAADYGLPQARKRALLVARRYGQPIAWPEPSYIDLRLDEAVLYRHPSRRPWITMGESLGRTFTGAQEWGNRLPSPAVVGSFRPEMHAPPRYRGYGDCSRQDDPGSIECSLEERMLLQGFPPTWQLAGPKTARDLQIGNAIPPVLARIALAAAKVGSLAKAVAA